MRAVAPAGHGIGGHRRFDLREITRQKRLFHCAETVLELAALAAGDSNPVAARQHPGDRKRRHSAPNFTDRTTRSRRPRGAHGGPTASGRWN
jgi:hypothetical protein